MQLRRHLAHVHELVPELSIFLLQNLVINSIAFFDDCALPFLVLISLFKALTQLLILQHLQVDVGAGALLNVGWCVRVRHDFLANLIEVLGDLVQVADAECHYSIKQPVHVSKGVALAKNVSDDLLVGQFVVVLLIQQV